VSDWELVDAALAEGRLTEDLWDIERTSQFLDLEAGALYQGRSARRGLRTYKVCNAIKYDPVDVRDYLPARATAPAADFAA
jgi:hypothetical protein